jgi:hypothetical protein
MNLFGMGLDLADSEISSWLGRAVLAALSDAALHPPLVAVRQRSASPYPEGSSMGDRWAEKCHGSND